MTLVEHLTELRKRIVISLVAVAVGAVIVFVLYDYVLDFMSAPYKEVTKGLGDCGPDGCDLAVIDPLAPFLVRIKVASYGGIILAMPVWIWQLWRFITPGLHPREKRYAIPFLLSSIVLFLLGGLVAWLTLDRALDFLLTVGGDSITPNIVADKYLSLVSLMFIAFGLAFEFPVVLVFLLLARVITTSTLRRYRRHAAVGIVAFAAVITPSQDPYSLFFMAGPMYLFYEASILIGRVMKR